LLRFLLILFLARLETFIVSGKILSIY